MEIRDQLQELEGKVGKGLEAAYRKLLEFKKRNNSPLIVSRNGKVIAISPSEITTQTNNKSTE